MGVSCLRLATRTRGSGPAGCDDEGSFLSVSGVGESGDGLDGGVLNAFGLLLLFDVPADPAKPLGGL